MWQAHDHQGYTNLLVSFRRISGSWKVCASIWDKPVTPATSRMAFSRLWVSDSILRSSWGSGKSNSGTNAASGAMWMGLGGWSSSSLSFSVDFLSLDLAALRFSAFWALSIPLWTRYLDLPYTLALFVSRTGGLHPAVGTLAVNSIRHVVSRQVTWGALFGYPNRVDSSPIRDLKVVHRGCVWAYVRGCEY